MNDFIEPEIPYNYPRAICPITTNSTITVTLRRHHPNIGLRNRNSLRNIQKIPPVNRNLIRATLWDPTSFVSGSSPRREEKSSKVPDGLTEDGTLRYLAMDKQILRRNYYQIAGRLPSTHVRQADILIMKRNEDQMDRSIRHLTPDTDLGNAPLSFLLSESVDDGRILARRLQLAFLLSEGVQSGWPPFNYAASSKVSTILLD